MKCLLDLDGVLANFTKGASIAHNRPYPYHLPENRGKFDLEELWGMTRTQFWKPLDKEFWESLEPMHDAFQIVELLLRRFNGKKNVCILSSPSENDGCLDGKRNWIKNYFPDLSRQFLLGPQKEFCAHSGAVLLDDFDRNVTTFIRHGGNAYLIPRPWNSGHQVSDESILPFIEEYLNAFV